MNIKSVAKDITDIFEQIRDNYHEYCYDGDYSYLMDKKLEAKIKLLIIGSYLPIIFSVSNRINRNDR